MFKSRSVAGQLTVRTATLCVKLSAKRNEAETKQF